MRFVDAKGIRYEGRLEAEVGSHGHPDHILVLTPTLGGEPRKVTRYDLFLNQIRLTEATLDDRARLDRAEYQVRSAPRRWSPREQN